MKINRYETKKSRGKTTVFIEFEVRSIEADNFEDDHAFITRKLMWNKWILKHLVTFCPWDFGYNTNLFSDSLMETGRNLIENGNTVTHIHDGRQAMQAAGMLKQCDSGEIPWGLDTSKNQWSRHTTSIEKIPNTTLGRMKTTYTKDNAMGMDRHIYADKMSSINLKKHNKYEKDIWNDAWDFIKKRGGRWWD